MPAYLTDEQAHAAPSADATVADSDVLDANGLTTVSPLVITAPPRPTGAAKNAGRARAIGQGLFSLGDEAEAGIRWLGGAPYKESLAKIRHDYEVYKRYNPAEAGAIELGTGIASAFIPGVGLAGKGFEAASGVARLAPLARVALTGAAEGALSGAGAGEGTEGRVVGALTGGALGAGGGAALHGAGGAFRWGREVLQNMRGPSEATAVAKADEILSNIVKQSGMTQQQVLDRMRLDQQYGVPSTFGQAGDTFLRYSDIAMRRPSRGQQNLISTLAEQQRGAPQRVQGVLQAASPSQDFFATEANVMSGLRSRAKTAYDAAYAAGDVNDPRLNAFLATPEGKALFADAQRLVSADRAGAVMRGEDPEQYGLRPIFTAVRDAAGNVIDMTPTGNVVPDVRTLDYIKKAMDARITSGYRSSNAADAAMATSLKGIRNDFVDHLDDLVPEYKAARQQYKGDIEIADALTVGRTVVPKMRWQQFEQTWAAASPGEREALRTGTLQRLMEPIEDSSHNRNWAQNIIGNENWRNKLQTMLPPQEYAVIQTALQREAELFGKTSSALSGSQTYARFATQKEVDDIIDGGDLEKVADVIAHPRGLIRLAVKGVNDIRNANVGEGAYTVLANALAEKDPAKVADIFARINAANHAGRAEARVGLQQRLAGGAAAASGGPPSAENTDTQAPRTAASYVDPVLPDLGGEPLTGGQVAPSEAAVADPLASYIAAGAAPDELAQQPPEEPVQ